MSTSRTTWVAWSLVLLGLVLSALLLSRSLALASSDASGGIDICGAVFGGGCDEALRDQGNAFLGIPLAGWGVVLYVVLAALLGMEWFVGSAIARPARTCAAATCFNTVRSKCTPTKPCSGYQSRHCKKKGGDTKK